MRLHHQPCLLGRFARVEVTAFPAMLRDNLRWRRIAWKVPGIGCGNFALQYLGQVREVSACKSCKRLVADSGRDFGLAREPSKRKSNDTIRPLKRPMYRVDSGPGLMH